MRQHANVYDLCISSDPARDGVTKTALCDHPFPKWLPAGLLRQFANELPDVKNACAACVAVLKEHYPPEQQRMPFEEGPT